MRNIYVLMLSFFFVSNVALLGQGKNEEVKNAKTKAEWTYMLYLYEDGTGLDGNKDLNEWEELGSVPDKINYVALYDCDNDAKDGIYYITKDPNGFNKTLVSKIVSTEFNKGLDMNDAETLEKFILWCKEKYPARHYGCNVWDHGNGIFKNSKPKDWKAACGEMTVWDLANAMKAFKDVDDKGFDIFGFDVCLLGQVETVHAIKDYTDVVIASEKTEPGDGWHYRTQFQILQDNPEVNVYDFARDIVLKYDESYDNGIQGNRATTQTAVRTDYYKADFVPALNTFSEEIIPEVFDIQINLREARNQAWYSDGIEFIEHRDLGHFLSLLKAKDDVSAKTKTNIDNLVAAYEKCIIETAQNQRPNATGLKIWIPTNISKNSNANYYLDAEKYLNISDTKWDEFLKTFENPVVFGKPKAFFKSNSGTSLRLGEVLELEDLTNCLPQVTEREWSFTPNTVEFVNCTRLDKKIKVRFLEAGTYDVSLRVSSTEGSHKLEKEDYIKVRPLVLPAPQNLAHQKQGNDFVLNWEDNANQRQFFEGFEGNWLPNGWENKYSNDLHSELKDPTSEYRWVHNTNGTLNLGTKYIHTGSHSAAIHYDAPGFNWLITPEIQINGYNKFRFWMFYDSDEDYQTSFRVMVKDGENWSEEYKKYDESSNEYASAVEIDLSKYANKNIKIAFVYEYTDGWWLGLDDIEIIKDVPDGTLDHYNVYRNSKKIAETKQLNYTDTFDKEGAFNYYVTSVYTNLDGESSASNMVNVTNGNKLGAIPVNLQAVFNEGTFDVNLTWEQGVGANVALQSYNIYKNNVLLANTRDLNYVDRVDRLNAKYEYSVTAVYEDAVGETDASNKQEISVAMNGAIPVNLTAVLDEDAYEVEVNWEAGQGANADFKTYKLYRNNELIATQANTSFTDNLPELKKDYSYKVVAVYENGVGETLSSNVATLSINMFGAVPVNLTANLNEADYSVNLAWEEGAGANAQLKSYKVYRDNKFLAEVNDRVYVDRLGKMNGDYLYKVTAVYENGVGETDASNTDQVSIAVVGAVPTNLTAQLNENTLAVVLAWKAGLGATADLQSYKVYRKNALIATVNQLSYTDQLVKETADYTYTVKAVYANGVGETAASNEQAVSVQMRGAVPTNLAANLNEENFSVALSWNQGVGANADLEAYKIYRNNVLVASVLSLKYTDRLAKLTADYTYKVKAVYRNGVGETAASNEQAVSVQMRGAVPTDLVANLNDVNLSVALAWNQGVGANADLQSYKVFRNNVLVATVNQLNYTDQLDKVNADYTYKVIAVYGNGVGESAASNEQAVSVQMRGATPANLNANLNEANFSVALSWEEGANASADLESYKLYRNDKLIATVNDLNYTDKLEKLTADYTYKVKAVYGNGVGETVASNEQAVSIQMRGAVPTKLTTNLNEVNSIVSLAWTEGAGANADLESYKVYRNNELIATVNELSFKDRLEKKNADYTYKVTAVYANGVGETAASNEKSVTVQMRGAVPSNLSADLNNTTLSVTLNWEKGDGATANFDSYKLYRNNKLIATLSDLTYTDQLEKKSASYVYKVTAVYENGVGETAASNEKTVQVNTTTGVEDLAFSTMKIQPNPSNGDFVLFMESAEGAKWSLYDMLGKVVQSGTVLESNTSVHVQRSGIYLLHVEYKGKTSVEKIIVR